jgi:hypothetical protein
MALMTRRFGIVVMLCLVACSGRSFSSGGTGANAGSSSDGGSGSGQSSGGSSSGGTGNTGGRTSTGGASSNECGAGCIELCEAGDCSCNCDPAPRVFYTCENGAAAGEATTGNPEQRAEVTGANGTFSDLCAADGNLLEYVCEAETLCEGDINPACYTFQTGSVVAKTVDCVGSCMDGTCAARCPVTGDHVKYLVIAETTAVFLNETDGRSYGCATSCPHSPVGRGCPDRSAACNVTAAGSRLDHEPSR